MLEGVKIVIERLQADDSNKGRWLDIADGIIKDPQQIFTEQERNEVRNVFRMAKRKEFNANIIDELNFKPKLKRKLFTTADMQEEADKILQAEIDKAYK